MTNPFEFLTDAGSDQPAALRQDVRVRVLNCSASGCLVETTRPVAPGTVGALRSMFGDRELEDLVHVVRCEAVQNGRGSYRVAAQFLMTGPADVRSLRYLVGREAAAMPGWSETER
jgi:hypothetical protein